MVFGIVVGSTRIYDILSEYFFIFIKLHTHHIIHTSCSIVVLSCFFLGLGLCVLVYAKERLIYSVLITIGVFREMDLYYLRQSSSKNIVAILYEDFFLRKGIVSTNSHKSIFIVIRIFVLFDMIEFISY